jgi:hypothetical protein
VSRANASCKYQVAVPRWSLFYSIFPTFEWHNSTSAALCVTVLKRQMSASKKEENGMFLDLPGGRRDRLLFICQATLPALLILMTTVSCSGPGADMPPPAAGIVELFTGGATEAPNQQAAQQDEAQPKVRRSKPKASASPKVATEQASQTASRSASRSASKKASTQPGSDEKSEQQLYREFLEWRKNQRDQQ